MEKYKPIFNINTDEGKAQCPKYSSCELRKSFSLPKQDGICFHKLYSLVDKLENYIKIKEKEKKIDEEEIKIIKGIEAKLIDGPREFSCEEMKIIDTRLVIETASKCTPFDLQMLALKRHIMSPLYA